MIEKKRWRKQLIEARDQLPAALRGENSRRIVEQLVKTGAFQGAGCIMAYIPFGSEVDIKPLIESGWMLGKDIVVPLCEPDTRALVPKGITTWDDLTVRTWGLLEPRPESTETVPLAHIDLVLVPGVAFDAQGYRLGYGAGYYDRFLPRLNPSVPVFGVAYAAQRVDRLPVFPHDRKVHAVVTEDGLEWITPLPR